MAYTYLKSIAIVRVTCENCGNIFTFDETIEVSSRGYVGNYEKLNKKIAKKIEKNDFCPHKCPSCAYLQSWMWEHTSGILSNLGCFTAIVLWFVSAFFLRNYLGIVGWLSLILSLVIAIIPLGVLSNIENKRTKNKYLPLLKTKGFTITDSSIVNITKEIPDIPKLKPDNLLPLRDHTFKSKRELLKAIVDLEGGVGFLLNHEDVVIKHTLKATGSPEGKEFIITDSSIKNIFKEILKFNPDNLLPLRGHNFETEDELIEIN